MKRIKKIRIFKISDPWDRRCFERLIQKADELGREIKIREYRDPVHGLIFIVEYEVRVRLSKEFIDEIYFPELDEDKPFHTGEENLE